MRVFKIALVLCIAQVAVLLAMYASSVYPIIFGREITIISRPIDPRDMLRGNYVRLWYENFGGFTSLLEFKAGTKVYALLEPDPRAGANGYKIAKITDKKPNDGVFLAGRIESPHRGVFGIEAFFLPVDKALELERELASSGALVSIGVLENGTARIKGVKGMEANEQKAE